MHSSICSFFVKILKNLAEYFPYSILGKVFYAIFDFIGLVVSGSVIGKCFETKRDSELVLKESIFGKIILLPFTICEFIAKKLSSLYKSIDKAEFDFYAEYDSNLNIAVKVSSVSIFDKDADMRVIEDLANYGVGYVAKVDTNLVVVGEPQFGKQRKIRNFSNGLQRVIKQESTTCVYEGEHRIFKVSLLVIDGEGFHNRQYHILLIQSCSKEKYSQYEGIMNSNIQSSIEHKADNSEKIYEFEDKDIGKIALRIDEDRYEATISDIGINLGEFKGADLVFEYEDDCSSLDEFIKCIDSFVKSFKYALKYRRKIMDALYKEAKEIYDIWLEGWYTPEQITPEFVKKHTSITCISVQKNSVSLSADYYDDNSENEDRDLGGHGFDIWLDQDDFKNNCDNIAWSLNG